MRTPRDRRATEWSVVLEKARAACYTVRMKIILSNTAHDAYHRVLGELKKRLPEGGEHIVIVPDRFTASSERGVIETLGVEAVFNVSVTSFTRLAEKTVGRRIKKCLTPQGSVMQLAKVIELNRDRLSFYGKAAGASGFAEEFYAALTSVRNSGISVSALRETVARAPEAVKGKLSDIALIYEQYLAALGDRRSDSSTRLEAFGEFLKDCPPIPAHYYVVDFYDFKSPELDVLSGIARAALSLTVGMVSGEGNPNRRIYSDGAAKRLAAACGGAEIERGEEELHPAADMISRRLFSYDPPRRRAENGGKVELRSAKTRSDEILALVTDIKRKVAAGARYKDFEVVLTDPDGYKAELKNVFLRYGVPFFIDTKEPLAEQTKPRCLMSALAVVRTAFRTAEVAEFVKNPLFAPAVGVSTDDIFRFENYCLRYNINHSRFLSEFTLGEGADKERAEAVRSGLVACLAPLRTEGGMSAEEFCAGVERFLSQFAEAWREHTDKLTKTSLYYAKCADQVDEKLKSLLDELADIPDAHGDSAYFERLFKAALNTVRIALVPTWLDSVYVGGVENRYLGFGDIYLLGANSGKLPAGKEGGAVITPRDEDLLAAFGVEISPSHRQRVYSELMSVTEIMKRPKGKLIVSYPESDSSGVLRPSTVVSELRGLLREGGEPISVRRVSTGEGAFLSAEQREENVGVMCSTPAACTYGVLGGLRVDGDAKTAAAAMRFLSEEDSTRIKRLRERYVRPSSLTPSAAKLAGANAGTRVSASRLESFFSCPYRHYFSYILGLRKRREAKPEPADFGTLIHAVLEKFFALYKRGGVNDGNLGRVTQRCFDESVAENDTVKTVADEPSVGRILERIRAEASAACRALYAAAQRSEYRPEYMEVYIGGKEIPALEVDCGDGSRAELRGKIDRVDRLGDKFYIVDYKSYASASFSFGDIYCGTKIQLYLYMEAIAECKGWTPVGVFYLPLSFDFTDGGASYRYSGSVTADRDEARKIDPLFGAEESEREKYGEGAQCILPYHPGRSRDFPPPHNLGEEQFRTVGRYVRALAGKGAGDIKGGVIAPRPVGSACKYCDFRTACAWCDKGVCTCGSVSLEDFETGVDAPRCKVMFSAEKGDEE